MVTPQIPDLPRDWHAVEPSSGTEDAAAVPDDRLGVALGHVRLAGARLLAEAGQASDSLLLGLECLDLEDLFADLDVVPAYITGEWAPADSLDVAIGLVDAHADEVTLAIWAALRAIRARLG